MKIYIKSSNDVNKQKRDLTLELEIIVVGSDMNIAAVSDVDSVPIADRTIAKDISKDYDEIVNAVIDIIHSYGFTDLDTTKSDRSNSIYFTFCKESEFEIEEVTLIIRMRVSDHEVPMWCGESSLRPAKDRMHNKLRSFANDNRFLNKNIPDDEEIQTRMLYVKYRNDYYSVYGDLFKKIRYELSKFNRI